MYLSRLRPGGWGDDVSRGASAKHDAAGVHAWLLVVGSDGERQDSDVLGSDVSFFFLFKVGKYCSPKAAPLYRLCRLSALSTGDLPPRSMVIATSMAVQRTPSKILITVRFSRQPVAKSASSKEASIEYGLRVLVSWVNFVPLNETFD